MKGIHSITRISPHLNCHACFPSSLVYSYTALCNYIHTAAQISGSVSKGFYHSTSLSHPWKYFAAHKRTWLLVSELPYTVNTFNQSFPLYAGWLVLATADKNNQRPVHNK